MATDSSPVNVRFVMDLPPEVAEWLKAKADASYKKPARYLRDRFISEFNREMTGKAA